MNDDQFYKKMLQAVTIQQNQKAVQCFLEEQDGNIDLVLTQFVRQLQLHFRQIYPDKPLKCGDNLHIDQNFDLLLDLLCCVFYGDKNAQIEVDEEEEMILFDVTKRQKQINKTMRDLISLSFRHISTKDI